MLVELSNLIVSYVYDYATILGAAALPTPCDYWHLVGDTRLARLPTGNHVSVWSEAGRKNYRLCAQILDAELKPIVAIDAILLPRQHFSFDVAALHDGGFTLAWTEKNLIKMKSYNLDGTCRNTIVVGQTSKSGSQVQLAAFPAGETAIGNTDFLAIQTATGLRLCNVSPNAWYFAMACQRDGSLVRVEMHDMPPAFYGGPPSYGLQGSMTNPAGRKIGQFYLDVPAVIVGDTYSHPDHLAISCLSTGDFVIAWTQLGHSLENSIQAQIFDREGKAIGETIVVTAATISSSVNEPSVVATDDGGFLVAWLTNEDPFQSHHYQAFGNDGGKRSCVAIINEGASEGRSAVKLAVLSSGQVVARWVENNQIQFCMVKAGSD